MRRRAGIWQGPRRGADHTMVCCGGCAAARGRVVSVVFKAGWADPTTHQQHQHMALPAAVWPRSPWAEIDAFLSTQPLTLWSTHHDVYDVHGGSIGLWWPGYGGHIELVHKHWAFLIRLPHELVRADRVPQAQFAPGLFAETLTPCLQAATRDQGDLVRLLSAVLPQVLAAPPARPPGASKRRGGEDDGGEGDDGYTGRALLSRCSAPAPPPPGGHRAPFIIKCEWAGARHCSMRCARRSALWLRRGRAAGANHTMVCSRRGALQIRVRRAAGAPYYGLFAPWRSADLRAQHSGMKTILWFVWVAPRRADALPPPEYPRKQTIPWLFGRRRCGGCVSAGRVRRGAACAARGRLKTARVR